MDERAWRDFLEFNPDIRQRWETFLARIKLPPSANIPTREESHRTRTGLELKAGDERD